MALLCVKHKGSRRDAEDYLPREPGNVPKVLTHCKQAHSEGTGVIGMKLVGEGAFTKRDDRRAAMRLQVNAGD